LDKAAQLRFDVVLRPILPELHTIGVGLYMRGLRAHAAALLLLIPLSVAGAVIVDILVGWPSAALLETYGVLAATAAAAIMRRVY